MPARKPIGLEIKNLSNLINRRIGQQIAQKVPNAPTRMHTWIIRYLYHDRQDMDTFQRDIEARFNIRRSTATGILQRMEKNGLITREPHPQDARMKRILLTDKAIQLHKKIIQEISRIEEQLFTGFSESEVETIYLLIKKLQNNIQ